MRLVGDSGNWVKTKSKQLLPPGDFQVDDARSGWHLCPCHVRGHGMRDRGQDVSIEKDLRGRKEIVVNYLLKIL
jgi:hypothetical protein